MIVIGLYNDFGIIFRYVLTFVKIKIVLFQDYFKSDLLGDTGDTFPMDDSRLRAAETPFACNCIQYVYIFLYYTYIYMYIFRKVIFLSLLRRTWKLGEVLLGYIQYVLFIASRLFRTGDREDIGVEGPPYSSTLHFHKPGLVSLSRAYVISRRKEAATSR